ncbi:hypothetical protein ES703_96593 [subsurface metagenome]
MTVGQYNAVNELGVDIGIGKPFGGIYRRIDHDTPVIQPDDVTGGIFCWVESMARSETCNARQGSNVRFRQPFSYIESGFIIDGSRYMGDLLSILDHLEIALGVDSNNSTVVLYTVCS